MIMRRKEASFELSSFRRMGNAPFLAPGASRLMVNQSLIGIAPLGLPGIDSTVGP
jgi:hypothetical protein